MSPALKCQLLWFLGVEIPSMGTIGSQARLDSCCRFAITISNEVVWISFRDRFVVLEILIRSHMSEVPFKQRSFQERLSIMIMLRQRFIIWKHHSVNLKQRLSQMKHRVVYRVFKRREELLDVVSESSGWIEEFIGVQMDQPIHSILPRLFDSNLHVEALHYEELMVARFVEESRQPGFIPRPAIRFHCLQLTVMREDFHSSPFA